MEYNSIVAAKRNRSASAKYSSRLALNRGSHCCVLRFGLAGAGTKRSNRKRTEYRGWGKEGRARLNTYARTPTHAHAHSPNHRHISHTCRDRCVSKSARLRVRVCVAHAHREKLALFGAAAIHHRAEFSNASDAACTGFQTPAAMQPCPGDRTGLARRYEWHSFLFLWRRKPDATAMAAAD